MGYWDKFKSSTGAKSGRESQASFNAFENAVDHRELIKPVLHRWDKQDLWNFVKASIERENNKNNGSDYVQLDETKVPKFMVYDIYNKYFTQQRDMKLKKPNEHNQWLYDFVMNNLQNYYTKPITDNSAMNSAIYTSEIVYQLLLLNEQNNSSGQQGGGEGQSEIENTLGSAGSNQVGKAIQKAEENAQQKIEDLKDFQEQLGGADESSDEDSADGGKQAGSGSNFSINEAENLQQYYDALHGTNLKSAQLNNFIKDTLKFSTSYFSSQFKESEDSIFDSDDIAELMGIENLLPQLRSLHIDDVVTTKRDYFMNFDVYIDMSGSMGGNRANSQLIKAKVTALKLHKLGLVDKLYCFDNYVTPAMSRLTMLKTNSGGGTSLENVVKQIEKLNRPSVVITDACDIVTTYTDKAYFIGVPGADFGYFQRNSAEEGSYIANKQCALMSKDGSLSIVTK